MNKKVIDIFPKKQLPTTFPKEKPLLIPEKPVSKPPFEEKKQWGIAKKVMGIGLPVLVLVFLLFHFVLSKAEIEIWPKTDLVTFKTKVTIDKDVKELSFPDSLLPGKIFEKEKTITDTFSSSGKILKEKKAEGTLKVYNAYSTSPQVLISNTRFMSDEGKVFRTPTRVTIPGGHYEKGKLVPGEIDIKVIADKAGPEYNIGPSTFSIPGFAGTDKYTKFYAKSFEAMKGGFLQEVPQVKKDDLEKAETSLVKIAKEEAETSLKDELKSETVLSEFYFLEDAIQTEIIEKSTPVKTGEEVESFNFQVKAKSITLLFKKEDLINFAKEYIISQIPKGKKLYEESLKVDYSPENINLNSGKITLSLDISAKIYSDIDISALKNGILGKSLTEVKTLLENQPEIDKIKIKIQPFWLEKVPTTLDKIKIKINLGPV